MLAIESEKTSLLDLSVHELSLVSWRHIDSAEFSDELKNPVLLERIKLSAKDNILEILMDEKFFDGRNQSLSEEILSFLIDMSYDELRKNIDDNKYRGRRTPQITTSIFGCDINFSTEFLIKYREVLPMYHAERQDNITPELVSFYDFNDFDNGEVNLFDFRRFFERFENLETSIGGYTFVEWYNYNDGIFRSQLTRYCEVLTYLPRTDLENLGLTVPEHYNTVMTEQRVMAGHPCQHGQRAYLIWLKKYRKVSGNTNGYPTWNDLLELYKKYPRINQHDYIDWLNARALYKSSEEVLQYSETLEYREHNLHIIDVQSELGDDYEDLNSTDDSTDNMNDNSDSTPESEDEVQDEEEFEVQPIAEPISELAILSVQAGNEVHMMQEFIAEHVTPTPSEQSEERERPNLNMTREQVMNEVPKP